MTYEIMKPETVGINKNNLVLGKHSGRHALNAHIQTMGYNLSDDELNVVFKKFKNLADKKKSIQDEDIEALINEGVLRSSEVFGLEYIHVLSGITALGKGADPDIITAAALAYINGLNRLEYLKTNPLKEQAML